MAASLLLPQRADISHNNFFFYFPFQKLGTDEDTLIRIVVSRYADWADWTDWADWAAWDRLTCFGLLVSDSLVFLASFVFRFVSCVFVRALDDAFCSFLFASCLTFCLLLLVLYVC